MIKLALRLFAGGSSLPLIIGGVFALIAATGGWLLYHDSKIWNKALESFNQKQEALVEQKNQEFQEKTVVIDNTATRIRDAIAQYEIKTTETSEDIMKNVEGDGAKPASQYLKSLVKQLEAAYGDKKK